jgi:hypothetical protein
MRSHANRQPLSKKQSPENKNKKLSNLWTSKLDLIMVSADLQNTKKMELPNKLRKPKKAIKSKNYHLKLKEKVIQR